MWRKVPIEKDPIEVSWDVMAEEIRFWCHQLSDYELLVEAVAMYICWLAKKNEHYKYSRELGAAATFISIHLNTDVSIEIENMVNRHNNTIIIKYQIDLIKCIFKWKENPRTDNIIYQIYKSLGTVKAPHIIDLVNDTIKPYLGEGSGCVPVEVLSDLKKEIARRPRSLSYPS
jgi:hypothetical protein